MLDVTELSVARKEAEAGETMFQLALESTEIAGWEYNQLTDTFVYTKNLPVVFGLRNTRSFTHKDFIAQIHPEDLSFAEQTLREALKTGEYAFNARIVWPNGTVHWIETKGRVIAGAGSNKLAKIIGVCRDFTEERKPVIDGRPHAD
jgi:PAS domain-containing protein